MCSKFRVADSRKRVNYLTRFLFQIVYVRKKFEEAELKAKENIQVIADMNTQIAESEVNAEAEAAQKHTMRIEIDNLTRQESGLKTQLNELNAKLSVIESENNVQKDKLAKSAEMFKTELDQLTELLNRTLEKFEKIRNKVRDKEIDIEEMKNDKKLMEG